MEERLGRAKDYQRTETRSNESSSSRRKGIEPGETRKAGKVPVRRAQGEPMLDRQRSEMRIRHEIGIDTGRRQQLAEHIGMPLGWRRGPHRLHSEPTRHLVPG